jgi:hypothetical protein
LRFRLTGILLTGGEGFFHFGKGFPLGFQLLFQLLDMNIQFFLVLFQAAVTAFRVENLCLMLGDEVPLFEDFPAVGGEFGRAFLLGGFVLGGKALVFDQLRVKFRKGSGGLCVGFLLGRPFGLPFRQGSAAFFRLAAQAVLVGFKLCDFACQQVTGAFLFGDGGSDFQKRFVGAAVTHVGFGGLAL